MNKQQVFYIHGGSAFSNYDAFLHYLRTAKLDPYEEKPKRWPDSLTEDLGDGYEVFRPSMPNSKNSKYEEWKIWFERHFEFLRDGVILLGWSQGGMFLAKYLIENELPFAPKALILAAAPFEPDDFDGEDIGDFVFDTSRLSEIAKKVPNIHLLHSEDDFVVPFRNVEGFAAALPEATLHRFTDRNHFLQPEFPEMVQLIKSLSHENTGNG